VKLSPLERFLRLFTDVRPGEGGMALMMFANVFLILCAYYFLKPLREGWIVVSPIAGLEKWMVKAYTSFGQALLLVFVIAWYSRLVNRWPRGKVITWATLFCMSNMLLFWFVQPHFFIENLPVSGIAFYLWVGMFGVFVVAQFWAFAADVYSDEEGRRLIPMVAIGATAGAAFGSQITAFLVGGGFADLLETLGLEALAALARQILVTKSLLLLALFPLGASVVLTRIVDRRRPSPKPAEVPAEEPASASGGLSIVLGSRYLLAVAIITLLLNWVNTNGENLLTRVLQSSLQEEVVALGLVGKEVVDQFIQGLLRQLLHAREHRGAAAPGLRGFAAAEVRGIRRNPAVAACRGADLLRGDGDRAGPGRDQADEGGRELHRLFDQQHGAPRAVAARAIEGEAQGQAHHRLALRAGR
jgi:AAA family ATP:ADP antiporter